MTKPTPKFTREGVPISKVLTDREGVVIKVKSH